MKSKRYYENNKSENLKESFLLITLVFFAGLAVVPSLFKEKIAAILFFASGLGLATFSFLTAGSRKIQIALIIGGPFFISGLLMFLSGKWNQKSEKIKRLNPFKSYKKNHKKRIS